MTYATSADFIGKFGIEEAIALSNIDSAEAVTVDTAVLDENLSDVSAEIDAYLSSRYVLPLTATAPVLKAACLEMGRYKLDKNKLREDVRNRYEDWVKFLRDIAAGKASLGIPVASEPPSYSPVDYSTGTGYFTEQALEFYP